jgi:hypothetical protein
LIESEEPAQSALFATKLLPTFLTINQVGPMGWPCGISPAFLLFQGH